MVEMTLKFLGPEEQPDRWKIHHLINAGSFGSVYLIEEDWEDKTTEPFYRVVKVENLDVTDPGRVKRKTLLDQGLQCIEYIHRKCTNISEDMPILPQVLYFHQDTNFKYMVLELLGPNLQDIYNLCLHSEKKGWDHNTFRHVMIEMLKIFRELHKYGVMHRDQKPENIVVGRWPEHCRRIYLLDFGLAKQFYEKVDGKKFHVEQRFEGEGPRPGITGTARYVSSFTHYGDQSRRDDLISFGHAMAYLANNSSLPWNNLENENLTKEEKLYKVLEIKEHYMAEDKNIIETDNPLPEFHDYMRVCWNLPFNQKPPYDELIEMLEINYDPAKPLAWEDDLFLSTPWPVPPEPDA